MLENLTKWVGALVPLISPYPMWVKLTFALFVLSGAVFFVGLVISAPSERRARNNQTDDAWLVFEGVTLYRYYDEGVRITADVNGNEFVYPTLTGIKWLKVGPGMSPQSFQIPLSDSYNVRFSATLKSGYKLASVETQTVSAEPHTVRKYRLRLVEMQERGRPVIAEVHYRITSTPP